MSGYDIHSISEDTKAVSELTKTLVDLYKFGRSVLQKKNIKKFNNETGKDLYKKIRTVEYVKTIWQYEKEINLREFYYPSKVLVRGTNQRIEPKVVSDISQKYNIVIEGTAGQGKSILLRYLASNELRTGNKIPVFVELRKIEKTHTLIKAIENRLIGLGFIIDDEILDSFLRSGKILLLLDGFDELPKDQVRTTINQIESLLDFYESTQVVITSRPQNDIQSSEYFRVVKISELTGHDRLPFLQKICDPREQANVINDAIIDSKSEIKNLLKTPLLLTLLTIVFNAEQTIPSNFSDFYDKLFQILYTRHDASKPGFKRNKRANLSEEKLELAFSTFCFLLRKEDKTSTTRSEALDLSVKASEISGIIFNADDFLEDITKITCLLIEEGMQYHFIHKSVQEFFCARFIKRLPEEAAIKFYQRARSDYSFWSQELIFLKSIDSYRALKNFYIPEIEYYLEKYDSDLGRKEFAERFTTNLEIGKTFSSYAWFDNEAVDSIYENDFKNMLTRVFSENLKDIIVDENIYGQAIIIDKENKEREKSFKLTFIDEGIEIGLNQALDIIGKWAELEKEIKRYFGKIRSDLEKYKKETKRQESLGGLIDF